MSLSVGRSKLMAALKDLRARWDKVQTHWDDQMSKDFTDEFIAPLEGSVRSAVSAMEAMYEIVQKARKECE